MSFYDRRRVTLPTQQGLVDCSSIHLHYLNGRVGKETSWISRQSMANKTFCQEISFHGRMAACFFWPGAWPVGLGDMPPLLFFWRKQQNARPQVIRNVCGPCYEPAPLPCFYHPFPAIPQCGFTACGMRPFRKLGIFYRALETHGGICVLEACGFWC